MPFVNQTKQRWDFGFKKRPTRAVGNNEGNDELFFADFAQAGILTRSAANDKFTYYTGGNLYAQSLIDKHFAYLRDAVYGNPHPPTPLRSFRPAT